MNKINAKSVNFNFSGQAAVSLSLCCCCCCCCFAQNENDSRSEPAATRSGRISRLIQLKPSGLPTAQQSSTARNRMSFDNSTANNCCLFDTGSVGAYHIALCCCFRLVGIHCEIYDLASRREILSTLAARSQSYSLHILLISANTDHDIQEELMIANKNMYTRVSWELPF